MNLPSSTARRDRVILLAAGQGSRLDRLTRTEPKPLLPVGGEPLLVRTVAQLEERGFHEITVVVGYRSEQIAAALQGTCARLVHNPDYAIDTNIGSLLRGLEGRDDPALIIEADVAFDGAAANALGEAARDGASVWFTRGDFQPHQIGGILRTDDSGQIEDLRYVPAWEQRFARHRKLLGILYAGRGEMPAFHQLLRTAAARSLAQYFMIPWCEHLELLPAREGDLSRCRTATFNTEEDYRQCQELFTTSPAPCLHN